MSKVPFDIPEGGIADIYINLNQDGSDSVIMIPLASSTCKFIVANKESGLGSEILWSVKPTEKLVDVVFNLSDTKVGYEFEWSIYLKNYFILFGGWIIFISSLVQVSQFLRKS